MATRRRAREVSLQMLFQLDSSDIKPEDAVELYKNSFGEGNLPDEFSLNLYNKVIVEMEKIDKTIVATSNNWRIDRMSHVDRNILRIGVCEILWGGDEIPIKVAINESVELAKRFGSLESASFVNGILDRIARDESKL